MPVKVTIAKGKGKVTCILPGFTLIEGTKPSVHVDEFTEQLDNLIKRGLVTVEEISEGSIEEFLKKKSKQFTAKAKADRLAQLREEKKTGGVSQQTLPGGIKATVAPMGLTPDEVRALAAAEEAAIDGKPDALDNILNDEAFVGAIGSEGS